MKRSRINDILTESDEMIRSFGFNLPKFAYWSVKEFVNNKDVAQNIINSRLGWDITDYGSGNFDKLGLFLFTLRNGKIEHLRRGIGMCYAEKLMISRQDQLSPMHRHLIKAEDIINRGGAKLVVELYGSNGEGMFDENSGGTVYCDGVQKHFKAGGWTHTFKRDKYEWDVGIHYIGEVHSKRSPVRKLFEIMLKNIFET